ncbi:MAG: hypothetical protein KIT27_10075, partial [Legionellales bacterium]|nr:hypothetical protein [Legionellales bacterium]
NLNYFTEAKKHQLLEEFNCKLTDLPKATFKNQAVNYSFLSYECSQFNRSGYILMIDAHDNKLYSITYEFRTPTLNQQQEKEAVDFYSKLMVCDHQSNDCRTMGEKAGDR